MDFTKIIYITPCNPSSEQFLVMFPSVSIEENNTLYSWNVYQYSLIIVKSGSYLLTSQTLLVISSEAEATKSPPECHVQDHTAWLCPSKVNMHSFFARSHNLTVESPLEVANLLPLFSRKQEDNLFKMQFMFFSEPCVYLYILINIYIYTYIYILLQVMCV